MLDIVVMNQSRHRNIRIDAGDAWNGLKPGGNLIQGRVFLPMDASQMKTTCLLMAV